jgi:hypothetical protein
VRIGQQIPGQQRQDLLYLGLAGQLRHPLRERSPTRVALLELHRARLYGQDIPSRASS